MASIPERPGEDFGPELVPAGTTYRNLALLRPAYHSSSYDYNLTAQPITDGIKDAPPPMWIATSEDDRGALPKEKREILVDHFPTYTLDLRGRAPAIETRLGGGEQPPEVDRVDLVVTAPAGEKPAALKFSIAISDDGRTWKSVGRVGAATPSPVPAFPGSGLRD